MVPPRAHPSRHPNGISITLVAFGMAYKRDQQTDRQTDRHTDHATPSVATGRIAAMRPRKDGAGYELAETQACTNHAPSTRQ